VTQDHDQIVRQTRALERRIDVLESIALRIWCLLVAAVLIAGALVPYAIDTTEDDPISWSVLTTPSLQMQEAGENGADPDVEGVLLLIGFIGLLLVVLAMLVSLVAVLGRRGGRTSLVVMRTLVVLGLIGSVVVLLLAAVVTGNQSGASAAPGGLVLLVGVSAYATLLRQPVRDLWQLPPLPERPAVRAARPPVTDS